MCFDHSDLYLQSETLADSFASVKLSYEHCIETDPTTESCADQETTVTFWDSTQVFLQFDFIRVVMSDASEPLSDFRKFIELNHKTGIT